LKRSVEALTFDAMDSGRAVRLLLLLIGVGAGAAGLRAEGPRQAETNPTVSSPRESLPLPTHNEATCAFCQAAIFPPCTPTPVSVPSAALGPASREAPPPGAQIPHSTSGRPASSRAPPTLQLV